MMEGKPDKMSIKMHKPYLIGFMNVLFLTVLAQSHKQYESLKEIVRRTTNAKLQALL